MTARICIILNGRHNDQGFVQEGYEGALAARNAHGFDLEIIEHQTKEQGRLEELIEHAAGRGANGVIVHGSRADAPTESVAGRHPGCMFLSPGGRAAGDNVWNYAIKHYEAAFLAGVLAARMTKTGTIGHLSGVFISPGKKGRAAYVNGANSVAPEVEVLTGFCGDQDEPYRAEQWTSALADAGVDVVFTMLNYGRSGAIAACRKHNIRQIGNIRNWCLDDPSVFVGSVLTRHRWSIESWIEDLLNNRLLSGQNRHPGLEVPEAVGLCMAEDVPQSIRDEITATSSQIISGKRKVQTNYDGPEFAPVPEFGAI